MSSENCCAFSFSISPRIGTFSRFTQNQLRTALSILFILTEKSLVAPIISPLFLENSNSLIIAIFPLVENDFLVFRMCFRLLIARSHLQEMSKLRKISQNFLLLSISDETKKLVISSVKAPNGLLFITGII